MSTNEAHPTGPALLESLNEEITWLDELESSSRAMRDAALDAASLAPLLEKKSELVGQLAGARDRRRAVLLEAGRADSDLLVHILGLVDKAHHGVVVSTFSRYVDAQRRAARAVAESREFFEVALDVVERMHDALVGRDDVTTYDLAGPKAASVSPLALSQLT